MTVMRLRPHHVLDIISGYGAGIEFAPHPYGHAVHTVARIITSNLEQEIEFIIGADEICYSCIHLQANGQCDDVLSQLLIPVSKQQYNDNLDGNLLEYLEFSSHTVMTMRKYLEIIARKLPGLEELCAHPKEDRASRLYGLQHGLSKLGISVIY